MSLQIAFLGAGRMASAIVDGLLATRAAAPADVAVLGGAGPTAAALAARTGVRLASDLPDLLRAADVVVVAFKPQHLAGADPRLAELTRGKLVLSVLAAKTLARLAQTFPHARNLVRTMPNTPAAIGAGVTGWAALRELSQADRTTVVALLRAMGREIELPEDQIDALMAVSGCGPAFVFEFTAALREAGVACGLARETADLLARVGLGDRSHHFPQQLSGGEQQRVALARAFVNEPKILFADEPTGNLDGATGERIVQLLQELNRERGCTIVLVTHDAALAARTQRTIRLRDGVIVEDIRHDHAPQPATA